MSQTYGGSRSALRSWASGCPRWWRSGQTGCSQVHTDHGVGLGTGQTGGDPGPEITSVSGVALITQAVDHQPMPQHRDRLRAQPAGRRCGREAEPGQRRHDNAKRVRRVTAMRRRVTQQRQQVQIFAERARPAMGQQQRQRIRATPRGVHQVHQLTVHIGPQVSQQIQPGLPPGDVERLPIRQQLGQPISRHTTLPAVRVSRGKPEAAKTLPQAVQRVHIERDTDRLHNQRPTHLSSMSVPTPTGTAHYTPRDLGAVVSGVRQSTCTTDMDTHSFEDDRCSKRLLE